jgi:uncharacterized protein
VEVNAAIVRLLDRQGRDRGAIEIACLPRSSREGVAALLNEPDAETLEPVQLLESTEYLYRVRIDGARWVTTDKPDVFDADDAAGFAGRLRTGLHTGLLRVVLSADDAELGAASFEVRSRKLDYTKHYRWMLGDIAEVLAELVMERFAPTTQQFTVDGSCDARTLYQRFAFLQALLDSERFEIALGQILSRPHRLWREEVVERRPSQGIAADRDVARQIAQRPNRVESMTIDGFSSLPTTVHVARHEETLDTPENRFVKFALTEWRNLSLGVARALEKTVEKTIPIKRGIAEANALAERLDLILAHNVLRNVGNVSFVPFGSQVLQKRDGYRDVFRFYLQAESAAALAWDGGEDVYGAGQRNVAVLYEYWAFLQLAKVVAELCNEQIDPRDLLVASSDGMGIGLRRGTATAIRGRLHRLGRELALDLRFNQSFGASERHESWTVPLRPDISLAIQVEQRDEIWVHFDAKYRIEQLREVFAGDADVGSEVDDWKSRGKRSDIVKMHAYHDAIRRSAGAYMLYPGERNEQCFEYHEILPGVGAFALRPAPTGVAQGSPAVAKFLDEVLTHVASQFSQHERGRFWLRAVFDPALPRGQVGEALDFLEPPPMDRTVLLAELENELAHDELRTLGRLAIRVPVGEPLPTSALVADYVLVLGASIEVCEVRAVVGPPVVRSSDGGSVVMELMLGDELMVRDAEQVAERAAAKLASSVRVVSWQDLGAQD